MTLTELSIKRPTLIIVIFSVLGVLGFFGFTQLKYDLFPKITAPIVTITTVYPGASPSEVETSVTKIVEDAISGIDKISALRSNSWEGRSMVMIEFEMSADIDIAIQDVTRKVSEIGSKLPQNSQKPIISKIAFDELPVMRLATNSSMPAGEFYQFVKDKIQPRLSRLDGVGNINLIGGQEREIKVNINTERMKAYGLSLLVVTNVIKASNLDFPTGKIKEPSSQYILRVAGKFVSLTELKNLIVGKSKSGSDIRLSDIAEIEDGFKEFETLNRLDGVNSIGMTIQKQTAGNTVDVCNLLKKELKNLEKEYSNIKLNFQIAQDGSIFIMDSANAVKSDLALAIILVAIVMLVFLHSIRNSLIVLVAIPSSLVSTFFVMYMSDFSLNLMTLLAMSLVIGILVDDSIVVLENIYRHLEMGDDQRSAALKGRNEIGFAALSITMVDVVVFVPLALITGMIGNFLREYALVVVFSTLMSLFVSFTITPMLASRFTKLEHINKNSIMGKFAILFENMFQKVVQFYSKTLKWSLRNGVKVIFSSFLLVISSFLLLGFGFIGFEFLPQVDRSELTVTLELSPGSSVENTNRITLQAEEILSKIPEVEKVLSSVGSSSEGIIGLSSNNNTDISITLVAKNKRSDATDVVGQKIKKELSKITGVKIRVNPVSLFGSSTRSPIQILVTGTSFEKVSGLAQEIAKVLRSIDGTTDVRLSSEEGKPELKVSIDRKKMSDLGLSLAEIGQTLRIGLTGDNDAKYEENGAQYDIRIVFDRFDRSNVDQVRSLSFTNNKGQQVQLSQFASVVQTLGPTRLERENRSTSINVYSQAYGKTSGAIAQEFSNKFANAKIPEGVLWSFAGEQKAYNDSMISLLVALFAGILFVYLIMVALYDSFLYPFVVLFSIPVALVGAFLALALFIKSISIYSMLGIIMLIGLVSKNAILLVDRTNQMRTERGLSVYEALIEAGQTRLRPILMTTFTMIVGMMPIAFSSSAGSETKSGLAIAIIGGLTSSLLLTLVLVPVVYTIFENWKVKAGNLISALKLKKSVNPIN